MLVGRITFGLLCIYMGYLLLQDGHEFYQPFLHGARRVALGKDSKNRINPDLTYNDVFRYVLKAVAVFYMLGGVLIAVNRPRIAAFFLILAISFMIATSDNPTVRHEAGSNYRKGYPWASLLRHVGMLGGVLLACSNQEEETEESTHEKHE